MSGRDRSSRVRSGNGRAETRREPADRYTRAEIADLVDRLAACTESVCRRYLSAGRREGGYWRVGDLANTPGRSLYVRLKPSAKGSAGKWVDAESGEHGDLLDIIRAGSGLRSFTDVVAEARAFLGLPADDRDGSGAARNRCRSARGMVLRATLQRSTSPDRNRDESTDAPDVNPRDDDPTGNDRARDADAADGLTLAESIDGARRLFMASVPIQGTLAETYLRRRGITAVDGLGSLRFHPACLYRDADDVGSREDTDPATRPTTSLDHRPSWRGPALIAAATDAEGWITGVQRTWLDQTWLDPAAIMSDEPLGERLGKADLPVARRSLGLLTGTAVRFPALVEGDDGILLVGEGVETVLSLLRVLPTVPLAATLSAGQLAGFDWPPGLRRLLIAEDADPAGRRAAATLAARAVTCGVVVLILRSSQGDFNDDLRRDGLTRLAQSVRAQLLAATGWHALSDCIPSDRILA